MQKALRQEIEDLKREVASTGLLDGSTIKAEHQEPAARMVEVIEEMRISYLRKRSIK